MMERRSAVCDLVSPHDDPQRQNQKLAKIVQSLMRRVEQATDDSGAAYAHFEQAIMLEDQVRTRTDALEKTLDLLNQSNAQLQIANDKAETARADLYNALEAVREGFALFDPGDRLIMCNSRFCQQMPDVKEMLGQGLLFADYVRLVSQSPSLKLPLGRSAREWANSRLRKHQKAHVNFNVPISGNRWLQISEHRTPNNGTAILQTDITAMIRLERQERARLLDDQAKLIRATLDHVNQGIAIFDADDRLVGWNDTLRAMLNLPARSFPIGTCFAEIIATFEEQLRFFDNGPLKALMSWAENRAAQDAARLELHTSDGIFLDLFSERMPDGGFVVSFTDVTAEREAALALHRANEELETRVEERTTALKEALQDAERANASKSRFVAAASHDLLQPLNAAKLFLSSLASAEITGEQALLVSRIDRAFDSVESILSALLDMSKLDSGKATLDVTAFAIGRVTRSLEDQFQPVARQKSLQLRFVHSDLTVISDLSYLRRILQNLIANAVHYTEQGAVLVGCRRAGHCLRLEVLDTGPGIPAEQQSLIFNEFQRLNQTGGARNGMGLGLAIVERACCLLGHDLLLQSVPGSGSRFAVTIPVRHCEQVDHSIRDTGQCVMPSVAAHRLVLMIENDETARQATGLLLESWGMQVLDVASAAEAVTLLHDVDVVPDLLLADYHLDDGQNGINAIQTVRERYGMMPAIVVTADRDPHIAGRCAALDLSLLAKPIEPDRFRAWIEQLTRKRPT